MAQQRSAEDVVRQAVVALATKDQSALDKLTIDQAEFNRYVWPSFAARVSGPNMNAEKYYPIYQKSSQVGITEASTLLAGSKWEVLKVATEPTQKGKGYQLHSMPQITLRDESGREKTVQLMGGLLERDGVYNVTTFYVSPSQRAAK